MTMEGIIETLGALLWAGWVSLLDYLAAHVLLCLVPAFVIAGFLVSMVPQEAVTRYLGPKASKWVSFPAAALGGFVLAVCSCTIIPLFAGIWKRGAGLGPAITFLFVGPAINILAITYTGAAIGFDVAFARLILAISFGIVIGLMMTWAFYQEQIQSTKAADSGVFAQKATVRPVVMVVLGLLFMVLIVGTLQINLLTDTYFSLNIPFELPSGLLSSLESAGLTIQGLLLILLLIAIGLVAWVGIETVFEKFSGWSYAVILLVAMTLLIAAPKVTEGSLVIGINGRFLGELFILSAIGVIAWRAFTRDEIASWLWETWRFAKQIFPLLIVGVFVAGILTVLIPEVWVQTVAGRNTIWANMGGVVFGIFMYFPTLVEVPVARMFLDLGMARGPLLAYLLAAPGLSIQSMIVLSSIMGKKKTVVYVSLVAVLSTLSGFLFGLWQ
jgi:uncharacterized protein